MAPDIDGVLNHADEGRRGFLRKLIAGAAFAPPLLASFSLDGLSLAGAEAGALCIGPNQTNPTPGVELCFDSTGTQYEDSGGQVGIIARAVNASVNSSVTHFCVAGCSRTPPC